VQDVHYAIRTLVKTQDSVSSHYSLALYRHTAIFTFVNAAF
jgi:hypothetical protein